MVAGMGKNADKRTNSQMVRMAAQASSGCQALPLQTA
jgi:hypothetical protein